MTTQKVFDLKLLADVPVRWAELYRASEWEMGDESSLGVAMWSARNVMRGIHKGEGRVDISFRENGYKSECSISTLPGRREIGRGESSGQNGQLFALHFAVCRAIEWMTEQAPCQKS